MIQIEKTPDGGFLISTASESMWVTKENAKKLVRALALFGIALPK